MKFSPAWIVRANESCCMVIDPLSAQACMLTIPLILGLLLRSVQNESFPTLLPKKTLRWVLESRQFRGEPNLKTAW